MTLIPAKLPVPLEKLPGLCYIMDIQSSALAASHPHFPPSRGVLLSNKEVHHVPERLPVILTLCLVFAFALAMLDLAPTQATVAASVVARAQRGESSRGQRRRSALHREHRPV